MEKIFFRRSIRAFYSDILNSGMYFNYSDILSWAVTLIKSRPSPGRLGCPSSLSSTKRLLWMSRWSMPSPWWGSRSFQLAPRHLPPSSPWLSGRPGTVVRGPWLSAPNGKGTLIRWMGRLGKRMGMGKSNQLENQLETTNIHFHWLYTKAQKKYWWLLESMEIPQFANWNHHSVG